MEWLKQIAPTIATALGGPLAGLAVTALAKAFGVASDQVQGMIESGKLSAEQIAEVKVAEIELKKQAQSLGLNFEQLAVQDRVSARDMQTAVRSRIPAILSVGVTVGFFGILIAIMRDPGAANNQPLLIMLGSLGTAWIAIMNFWFGSTNSSQRKDQMLFESTPLR